MQMEQSGMTCTTEHLVYFLTEMFKNIAEEILVEARRVVQLKAMADINEMKDFADRFKVVFKVNAAKQKLLEKAAQAAKDAEDAEALRRKLEEVERRRLLGEARRRREEEARWRREMAFYYGQFASSLLVLVSFWVDSDRIACDCLQRSSTSGCEC